MRRPPAVAVTGGIAAGKSEALAAFARHGAATLSADAIVHDLLASDPEVREAIRDRWGADAVGDRGRIGEIVFADPAELEWLERLLHPRTRAVTDAWLATVDAPLAVVEVPLLYETGGESRWPHAEHATEAGHRPHDPKGNQQREKRKLASHHLGKGDFAQAGHFAQRNDRRAERAKRNRRGIGD